MKLKNKAEIGLFLKCEVKFLANSSMEINNELIAIYTERFVRMLKIKLLEFQVILPYLE